MTPEAGAMLRRLPEELRAARQWCVAGPDRAPYVVDGGTVRHASLHKPDEWKSFDEAFNDAARLEGAGLGFMISYADPWTCIDLDVKNEQTQRRKGEPVDPAKWTTQAEFDRYQKIMETFNTYTELSSGGFGLHLWVRGAIGLGARRDGVEVYSQERFIVCTGNIIVPQAIQERQELLEQLVDEIRAAGSDIRVELEELEEEDSDMEVWERASGAANGQKFLTLCEGKWQGEYPSQSEADLALMSMFAFYSKSNAQCRRLFRCTGLGQREKATKNDRYLNFTLEVIRGRQKREALTDARSRQLASDYVKELTGGSNQADVGAAQIAVAETRKPHVEGTSVDWPPGLAGAIAAFIYGSAPRPVKEVAIVSALGFLAGVCGKAFSLPQSGLNMYIILVARSGVGKEAMHTGLSLIMEELRNSIPAAQRFVDFTEYASGQALRKACATNPSFCNVSGEWGRRLKRLAHEDKPDGPMATLRTAMTDLYQKSGPASMVGGLGYSDKDKNTGTVTGVSYSMIGETTPGNFYESLTQSMMEDGFLSRFLIVDYQGERPPLNGAQTKMHPGLAQALHGLCAHALTLISRFATQQVSASHEASIVLDGFNLECDREINSTVDESKRQMWNRAHLKAMRLAALLAVADNWLNPVIQIQHAQWALLLVRRDINIMRNKLETGEVGTDDSSREKKLLATIREYVEVGPRSEAYGCPESLRRAGVVPKRYLQMRLCRVQTFASGRNGATKAIDETMRSLVDSGYLADADKNWLTEHHNYFGKAYRILFIPPKA